jgi:hypothetical protein
MPLPAEIASKATRFMAITKGRLTLPAAQGPALAMMVGGTGAANLGKWARFFARSAARSSAEHET